MGYYEKARRCRQIINVIHHIKYIGVGSRESEVGSKTNFGLLASDRVTNNSVI
jgi:hypothetical protein